ncbi:MAG: dihydrolipoamide acetyltransferase family protein [Bacillota bacterium]
MSKEIKMPKLGLTMEEGEVVNWHKEVGDKIEKGEIIVEIESDKISNEVESEIEGFLAVKLYETGDIVEVGAVLGVIAEDKEEITKIQAEYKTSLNQEQEQDKTKEAFRKKEESIEKDQEFKRSELEKPASPKAVMLAKKNKVDLTEVEINKGERITSEDVAIYLEKLKETDVETEKKVKFTPKAEKMVEDMDLDKKKVFETVSKDRVRSEDIEVLNSREEDRKLIESQNLSQMRKSIANRLTESWKAPHVYLRSEIKIDNLIELKELFMQKGREVSLTDLIALATIKTLNGHPAMNAHFNDKQINKFKNINLGMAVAVENGLVVPVIKSANKLSLTDLRKNIIDMVDKARSGNLESNDYVGGTFTISNLGMYGVDEFTAVINPPQVGILAVGRKKEKLILSENNDVKAINIINFTLGIDHRAIDGAVGAKFLQTLTKYIEEPLLML